MTYYQKNKERQMRLAREYRERNRSEINRKQRERYQRDADYRERQIAYQRTSRRSLKRSRNTGKPRSRGWPHNDRETVLNKRACGVVA